ncbi:hypothetical protein SynRS9907_02670 [Synechococcus sp. RS9907]|nr:hypothetical protein SynRS9907_02670 [Synechococcus sp. RS9907]
MLKRSPSPPAKKPPLLEVAFLLVIFAQEGLSRVNVSIHGGPFLSFPRLQER